MPVSCTRRPGAWPTMSRRAVGEARTTGRGKCGRFAAQTVHPCTCATSRSKSSSGWPGSAGVFDDVLLARIDIGVHDMLLLRLRFEVGEFGRAYRLDAERLANRILELGRLRGRSEEHTS